MVSLFWTTVELPYLTKLLKILYTKRGKLHIYKLNKTNELGCTCKVVLPFEASNRKGMIAQLLQNQVFSIWWVSDNCMTYTNGWW